MKNKVLIIFLFEVLEANKNYFLTQKFASMIFCITFVV
ncbi:Hypothetical protein Ccan_20930 [Capnocytophaga canimorsus Cc5]|uniref:Uncharacterized protein n=1 Tax=Capnocytophaga canimorsus (strain 5) TaxID=860228 RepID=F9YU91_CAPCC|nr:Hypothetical protein Ccan_20930 [Capnocytophaga canimorsus Cc5]